MPAALLVALEEVEVENLCRGVAFTGVLVVELPPRPACNAVLGSHGHEDLEGPARFHTGQSFSKRLLHVCAALVEPSGQNTFGCELGFAWLRRLQVDR